VAEQILACVSRQGCQPVFTKKSQTYSKTKPHLVTKKPDLVTKKDRSSHKKSGLTHLVTTNTNKARPNYRKGQLAVIKHT